MTETGIVTEIVTVTANVTETVIAIVTPTVRGEEGAGRRRGGGARRPNGDGKTGPGRPLRRRLRRNRTGIGTGKERGIVRRRLLMITEFHTPVSF